MKALQRVRWKSSVLFFYLKILFYLFVRDTEREREAETQAEEKQAPCREPDVGLDPRTPGSCPGPKADAQLLSHPGVPRFTVLDATRLSIKMQVWLC